MRVLIVDDNPAELIILEHILREAGYEVEVATNGSAALEAVHAGCRIVITDQSMPVMTGAELCSAIRSEGVPGYVYIILLTWHDSVEDRVAGLNAGADDFISKPCDHRELLARVRAGERVLALETRDVTIFALAKLAESRDPETGAHLERVRRYARSLACRLAQDAALSEAITPHFVYLIYLTSPMHDIGKVAIPDAVLLKPGPLDANEFEIMKSHTSIGAQTLDAALSAYPEAAYLRMARDIAAAHHERFDGTGYPGRLEGEQIPLSARIVALADVYDALTSKRVYKEAIEHRTVRKMIVDQKSRHFDPQIVDAFVGTEEEFVETLHHFQEHDEPAQLAAVG